MYDVSEDLGPKASAHCCNSQQGSTLPSASSDRSLRRTRSHDADLFALQNVRAQHQLVTSHLSITHLHAVVGWSMGAGQTFAWGAAYPDFMDHLVPFCGAARTAEHNKTFLYSLINTVQLDSAWNSPEKQATEGKKAFASIYSAWGFSQAFYRERLYRQLGFETLDDFLGRFWAPLFAAKDARNLVHMLRTWIAGDIVSTCRFLLATNPKPPELMSHFDISIGQTSTPDRAFTHDASKGRSDDADFKKALASITAKTLVMPGLTDLYFPVRSFSPSACCNFPLGPGPSRPHSPTSLSPYPG